MGAAYRTASEDIAADELPPAPRQLLAELQRLEAAHGATSCGDDSTVGTPSEEEASRLKND